MRLASAAVLLTLLSVGGAYGQADSTYKVVERDPFARPKPKPVVVKVPTVMKAPPGQRPLPTIQIRIERYRAQKAIDMENNRPVQKQTSVLLLNKIEVTGIVRTPRGYAAMVSAKPMNLSYTIYPGEVFYDGQLVGVEENRLVFRRDIQWTNNKVTTVVEMKQLRQPQQT
ncbi:MAG: hypothetical protein WKF84_29440 [Pyrinomonadaceae bacterium]